VQCRVGDFGSERRAAFDDQFHVPDYA